MAGHDARAAPLCRFGLDLGADRGLLARDAHRHHDTSGQRPPRRSMAHASAGRTPAPKRRLRSISSRPRSAPCGLEHVVRTRLPCATWTPIGRRSRERTAAAQHRCAEPALDRALVGEYLVEIEAEAELPPDLTALPPIQERMGKEGQKEALIPPQLGSVSVDGDSFASDPSKYHLALLEAMVSAQTVGEEAVQDVVAAELSAIGCEVERVVYTPSGIALRSEFAASSAIASGERVAIVGRWTGSSAGAGGGSPEPRSLIMFAHPDGRTPRPRRRALARSLDTAAIPRDDGGQGGGGRRRRAAVYGWGIADDIMGVAAGVCNALAARRVRAARWPDHGIDPFEAPREGCAELALGYAADAALYLHRRRAARASARSRPTRLASSCSPSLSRARCRARRARRRLRASALVGERHAEGDGRCAFAFTAANQ